MDSYIFLILMILLSVCLKIYFPKIKGIIGENRVGKILNTLDQEKYIVLHDLYVPKENGHTSQIDHIVLSHQGIFVIETKNYTGWILGNENSQYWTQVIYKRKEKLYNPIWQNSGHIQSLKAYMGEILDGIPIFSVVVFSGDATLKFKEPFRKARVITHRELRSTILENLSQSPLSGSQISNIQRKLLTLQIEDKKQKKQVSKAHVKNIKEDFKKTRSKVQNNLCPRCGNTLITRTGKNGSFKGCSSFPKCRFTVRL